MVMCGNPSKSVVPKILRPDHYAPATKLSSFALSQQEHASAYTFPKFTVFILSKDQ